MDVMPQLITDTFSYVGKNINDRCANAMADQFNGVPALTLTIASDVYKEHASYLAALAAHTELLIVVEVS